jgi:hydrogenase-4 component F
MSPALVTVIALPALAALAATFMRAVQLQLGVLICTAVLHLLCTAVLWSTGAAGPQTGLIGLDALGLLVLSLVSLLFLAAAIYSVPYLRDGTHDEAAAPQRFVPCLLAFLAAMSLVTVSRNLALMWAAVEATTLASAPLIYFYRRPGSLEATWKYLLICSVGIALALLGTFFLGVASTTPAGDAAGLGIDDVLAVATRLDHRWLHAAFVLVLVGYGTKMGLAPLHTWLPDAHSQAPSPVSALLSGALLNCALLGILRFYEICVASGEAVFAQRLLLVLGFASVLVGAGLLLGQRDYKRLLAYSSVENMGVIAIGLGIAGSATYGALLHVVNHSLAKAGLFLLSGNVLRAYGSTAAADRRGVSRRLPISAALLIAAAFAIGGSPPFGPFVSELTIFLGAMRSSVPWLGVVFVVLLGVAFVGIASTLFPMLQGEADSEPHAPQPSTTNPSRRDPWLAIISPAVLVLAVLALGIYVPGRLDALLRHAAGVLGQ